MSRHSPPVYTTRAELLTDDDDEFCCHAYTNIPQMFVQIIAKIFTTDRRIVFTILAPTD